MQIPEIHKSNNRKYYFVKQYPNFVMYQTENGIVECFSYHELGMNEEMIEPPKSYLNVEKSSSVGGKRMTREDLKNYKFLKIRIDKKLEDYERDFARATKMTSVIDGMPKAQNKPNYVLEDFIDASNDIIELFNEDLRKQADIEKQLRAMNDEKYHTALYLRYIVYATERNPLEQVASTMNYSYNEMCKINGEALNRFDELDNSIKNHKTS